ncbi:receptor-type tyrosine-protein phosphatase s [Plakobranchus ocellatus]|uniref:Receptor-type tyrosine-protein phosphatase s n=1 Tax=Plakobranchus ocellatus TaxID=259542 RepID=A0AAV3Y4U7_9GAST|nr:receptor-type tyrosine-protein phosphatase s [Plakobranchus ocellatus]
MPSLNCAMCFCVSAPAATVPPEPKLTFVIKKVAEDILQFSWTPVGISLTETYKLTVTESGFGGFTVFEGDVPLFNPPIQIAGINPRETYVIIFIPSIHTSPLPQILTLVKPQFMPSIMTLDGRSS